MYPPFTEEHKDTAVFLTSRRLTVRWLCYGFLCAGGQQEAQGAGQEGTSEEGEVIREGAGLLFFVSPVAEEPGDMRPTSQSTRGASTRLAYSIAGGSVVITRAIDYSAVSTAESGTLDRCAACNQAWASLT